ncbi:hypothetical protein BF38_5580 (plasmid) [Bacillus thuringiensis]|uniref:Transposase n=1 Tax=Bacillus thuringiensis TaxID=1428 RepID=A0AB33B6S2_BACTU|nr:hypothetical protein BF38_5580 [Bacillus thuringiensis]
MQKEKGIPIGTQIRRIKYLNNIVEQEIILLKNIYAQCWNLNRKKHVIPLGILNSFFAPEPNL